jgi:hypothetical protein
MEQFLNTEALIIELLLVVALLDAYGWPHEVSDEEILARPLKLNLERAGRG